LQCLARCQAEVTADLGTTTAKADLGWAWWRPGLGGNIPALPSKSEDLIGAGGRYCEINKASGVIEDDWVRIGTPDDRQKYGPSKQKLLHFLPHCFRLAHG
jgi:hypothetical protein